MKKYIPILLATSLLLSACSIDWNDAKDKKIAGLEQEIVELKTKNNVEQEKLEFEKQKYEDSQIKESEEKCNEAYEKNSKKFEDFVNTCTGPGGNSIDFCLNSDGGKIYAKASQKKNIPECN